MIPVHRNISLQLPAGCFIFKLNYFRRVMNRSNRSGSSDQYSLQLDVTHLSTLGLLLFFKETKTSGKYKVIRWFGPQQANQSIKATFNTTLKINAQLLWMGTCERDVYVFSSCKFSRFLCNYCPTCFKCFPVLTHQAQMNRSDLYRHADEVIN